MKEIGLHNFSTKQRFKKKERLDSKNRRKKDRKSKLKKLKKKDLVKPMENAHLNFKKSMTKLKTSLLTKNFHHKNRS